MPPPKLPAHLEGSRRAEPPSTVSAPRSQQEDVVGPQLNALLASSQRLEQQLQTSSSGMQDVRGEVQTLRGEMQTLRSQIRDIPVPAPMVPPPLFEAPPPPAKGGAGALIAAIFAALASLGAAGVGAVVWLQLQHQKASLSELAAASQTQSKALEKLGEQVASLPPPSDPTAGKHGPGEGDPSKSGAAGSPAGCPPPPEPTAAKSRVLLPNLVGLRLGEARTTVAPLQLQLLPTDKKLKEASKIGWQSPNPGAELEPEEAVTVALKPPGQKKKKKQG